MVLTRKLVPKRMMEVPAETRLLRCGPGVASKSMFESTPNVERTQNGDGRVRIIKRFSRMPGRTTVLLPPLVDVTDTTNVLDGT